MNKLSQLNCSDHIIKLVKFLTHERHLHTNIEGFEVTSASKRLPQGGVLSPLLYLIYVINVTDNINRDVTVLQFADDIVMYVKFQSTQECKRSLQTALNTMKENFLSLGLELSPRKTTLVHFNNKKIQPGDIKIKLNGHEITSSETVRFLGLISDFKLSFIPHVNMVLTRCNPALNIINYLRGTWWGLTLQPYSQCIKALFDL